MELDHRDRAFVDGLCRQAVMVGLYAQTLHLRWRGESWAHTEAYAERCWNQLALMHGGPPWPRIRAFIAELWVGGN